MKKQQQPEITISRDAQIVAYCLFPFGEKSSTTFRSPKLLTPRAVAALQELEEMGFVIREVDRRPPVSWHFKGTEKLPRWRSLFKEPDNDEIFPLAMPRRGS